MRAVVLLSLLALPGLLAACTKKPDAPPTTAVAAPIGDTWPGKYEGDVMVRISPEHTVILVTAKPDGCSGDLGLGNGGLAASQVGDALEASVSVQDSSVQGGGECKITLKRNGDRLQVLETDACSAFHGATCPFSGIAQRVK